MNLNPVKVAVIGTGWWATYSHIPALLQNPNAELVALCDASVARLSSAAAAFGISRTYADHHVLLEAERPDAVAIATTHATHYTIARDCLNAGAHILVEKPLTLRASEAQELMEIARQRGLALLVGYPWNYTTPARRVRESIAGGQIGAVQFVQCTFNSFCIELLAGNDRSDRPDAYPVHGPGDVYSKKEHSGGGHGHLQMTHAAGLLFEVTGLRLRSVHALMANHGLPLDLVNAMVAEFEGGGLGIVGGTSNAFLPRMSLNIFGAKGSIEMDMHAGTTRLKFADGAYEEVSAGSDTYPSAAPSAHLIAIARGEEAPVALESGWRAVEMLDAAYRSAEDGGRSITRTELYDMEDSSEKHQV